MLHSLEPIANSMKSNGSLRGCVIQILVATFSCHSSNRQYKCSALYDLVHSGAYQNSKQSKNNILQKEIKADQK